MAIWPGRGATKKYQVKVKRVKLEGSRNEEREREMAVEMKWQGPSKPGFSSLYRKTHQAPHSKKITILKFDEDDHDCDEFVNVCVFSFDSKDPKSFAPWLVSFLILCGESESSPSSSSASKAKMEVIGKAELNLGELASKMEAQIEQKIPVALQVDGVAMEATLRVVVSFVGMRNNSHSRTASHDSLGVSPNDSAVLIRAKSQGPSLAQEKAKKNKFRLFGKPSLRNSDDSSMTSNSESEYVVVASSSKNGESNLVSELGSSPSSEVQLDLVKKGGFWKWKRRRSKKKLEFSDSIMEEAEKRGNNWETRELVSRDGKTKLKADVLFASYDQRGEKAAGESACAVIVALIAHWFLLKPGGMPTGPELDHLITEGSSEWRKLCEDESHKEFFPDHHFDLETILQAELRPLDVAPSNSRFGFFHPEEFEHLKDALSFDSIWDEINKSVVNHNEPRVYIVRWNDHFFVLKVEAGANYIIDSLGERLHEGCNQAYILKFDDSTVMYEKDEEKGGGGGDGEGEEGREEKVVCRGKECCREYMKRFLAAITVRELKEVEKKGKEVNVFALYHRLQIDFHLSTPSSSAVSTANTSVSASPNTSPVFFGHEEFVQV